MVNIYNEGGYKVLVLFGIRLRIRSQVHMLRHRMDEAEKRSHRLEKELQEQKQHFAIYQRRIEQKLTELEEQVLTRHDSAEKSVAAVRLEMKGRAEQFSKSIHDVSERLTSLQELQLDARCSANAAVTQDVSQRLAVLEHLQLGKACEKLQDAVVTVEQRLSEFEQLQLEQKVSQQQTDLHKMGELVDDMQKRLSPLASQKAFNFLRSKNFPAINRDYVASLVENYSGRGVSGWEGTPALVVSLTSYPARMYDIHLTLYSLLTQDLKPDKLILWLGEEQFPNRLLDVPRKVRDLEKWGLEIKWCADTKSYKKLLPSLQEYPEAVIVTADDDIYYPPHWLRTLWETYQNTAEKIVANRCHRVAFVNGQFLPYSRWKKCVTQFSPSYLNFMTGAGGVLYAPGSLHPDIFDIGKAQVLCPHNDDIWFWVSALRNGTRISLAKAPLNSLIYTNPEREANANDDGTLFAYNGTGGNDAQLKAVLAAYPELAQMLQDDYSSPAKVQ